MRRVGVLLTLSLVVTFGVSCATDSHTAARRVARRTRSAPASKPTIVSTTTTTVTVPPSTVAPTVATTVARAAAAGSLSLGGVRGHVIVVDAGHNGGNAAHASEISRSIFIGTQTRACDTTGTQTADGYTEHAYNLDVALRLRDLLESSGAHVVMIRTDDAGWGPCIDERARIGNRAHAEAGISVHADGGPSSGRGFHVNTPANIAGYTDDIYAASHTLGVALRDAYAAGTGMPPANYIGSNGMVERRDFGGLNLSDVPKVLFETGNMQNATDAALLESPGFRQRVAAALAQGFARYFASGA